MAIINLRDFYPWYICDELVEVPDVIAAELIADRKYEKAYKQRIIYNKAYYSLDAEDGIEASALSVIGCCPVPTPEAALFMMENHCRLCCALNSLPETQGRRIEARYLLGQSVQDIARAEGVGERNVRKSITRGLEAMKKYFNSN